MNDSFLAIYLRLLFGAMMSQKLSMEIITSWFRWPLQFWDRLHHWYRPFSAFDAICRLNETEAATLVAKKATSEINYLLPLPQNLQFLSSYLAFICLFYQQILSINYYGKWWRWHSFGIHDCQITAIQTVQQPKVYLWLTSQLKPCQDYLLAGCQEQPEYYLDFSELPEVLDLAFHFEYLLRHLYLKFTKILDSYIWKKLKKFKLIIQKIFRKSRIFLGTWIFKSKSYLPKNLCFIIFREIWIELL